LVKRTGVPKETIHYYIRSGILRKPRNTTVNSADYGESWVERIGIIRDMRENYFLPVPVIKRIFKHFRSLNPVQQTAAFLRHKYVRSLDQLLPSKDVDRVGFLEETGMSPAWLEKMEEWNIITPYVKGGGLRYSEDDLTLGRLMVDMDRFGLGPSKGVRSGTPQGDHGPVPRDVRPGTQTLREDAR
jgi:DNA-binding transcriptional MerR regulator